MFKFIYLFITLILLFLGIWKSNSEHIPQEQPLPSVNAAIDLNTSKANNEELPKASKAKTVNEYKSLSSELDQKMKKTTFSFSPEYKTILPRLSKEEIAVAPVVARIPMNVNNQDIEVVVVEKDGKTYDASDGVRIYMPESLKFHSEILDFLYK